MTTPDPSRAAIEALLAEVRAEGSKLDAAVRALLDRVVALSKFTQHDWTCHKRERIGEACTCGLDAVLSGAQEPPT